QYSLSKYKSELEVWRGINEGLNAVIVNPSLIMGLGSYQKGSGAIFEVIRKGISIYPPGSVGIVDVEDVARVMILLMGREDIVGERFILNSENISHQDLMQRIARLLGKKEPTIAANRIMLSWAWRLAKFASLFTGKKPAMTRETMRAAQAKLAYSNKKITDVLGYRFLPVDETLEKIANTYYSNETSFFDSNSVAAIESNGSHQKKNSNIEMKNYYIIDFDSTFTQVEALDELARISLEGNPDQEKVYRAIENYTNLAMEGKISFRESLAGRIALLKANKTHLQKLVSHLKKKVSKSFDRNRDFFVKNSDSAWIVSGGFKEFITPVVSPYGIKTENIYANTFKFDEDGNIIGYDETNPLSEEGGKVKLLKELNIQGRVFGIGDGYSDFQLKESGLIERFYAFTENIARQNVTDKADHVTPSFDEFLYVNDLPRAISYPKNRI